jgi:hypothetical protein
MRGVGVQRHFSRRIAVRSTATVASTSYRTRLDPANRPCLVKWEITSTVGVSVRTACRSSLCSRWLSFVHACTESMTMTAALGATAAQASRHEIAGLAGSSGCCPMRRTYLVGDFVLANKASTSARSCSASSQYASPPSFSAIFDASSAHTVDLPAPGSPPMAIFRPSTTPPRASDNTQSKWTGSSAGVPLKASTDTPGGGSCSMSSQTDAPQAQNPLEWAGR